MNSMVDQIFTFLIILIFVTAFGLMYKSWLDKKQSGKETRKKKQEILINILKKKAEYYQSKFVANDIEEIKLMLAKDYSLLVRGIPYRIDGIDEAVKWLQKAMEESPGQSIIDQRITLINDDAGIITFNWLRGGASGKTTHVWRHQFDDGWHLVHEHTSYNPNEK
ncbi:MAG: DUF3225 domain-containing protein [Calditrichaeota bacterium]|nr:MAG: DUF3225 domain-containing protein [Calditrichota bacterium]